MLAAGCAERPPQPHASDSLLPCGALPSEATCPGPAPARPVAMSPDGPVERYPSDYAPSDVILSENGAYVVSRTSPGTTGFTTVVPDDRTDDFGLVDNADVVLESVVAPELPPPPGGHVRLSTTTDEDGSFALIDVPARPEGTCYRLTVTAAGFGTYRYTDVYLADETYVSNVFMLAESQNEIGGDLHAAQARSPGAATAPPSRARSRNHTRRTARDAAAACLDRGMADSFGAGDARGRRRGYVGTPPTPRPPTQRVRARCARGVPET
jgi:hypothetical protein